jgi:hypothetical protein
MLDHESTGATGQMNGNDMMTRTGGTQVAGGIDGRETGMTGTVTATSMGAGETGTGEVRRGGVATGGGQNRIGPL